MTSPRSALVAVRLGAAAIVISLLSAFTVLGTATPAQAATAYQQRVVAEASKHRGKPYQHGAVGPSRFDCSGFTMYVFARFGKRLPHSSAQQYNVVAKVAKSRMAPGDLIFFRSSSGRITHVGIYAGGGKFWHAPRAGTVVKLAAIYSSNYVVGRI